MTQIGGSVNETGFSLPNSAYIVIDCNQWSVPIYSLMSSSTPSSLYGLSDTFVNRSSNIIITSSGQLCIEWPSMASITQGCSSRVMACFKLESTRARFWVRLPNSPGASSRKASLVDDAYIYLHYLLMVLIPYYQTHQWMISFTL